MRAPRGLAPPLDADCMRPAKIEANGESGVMMDEARVDTVSMTLLMSTGSAAPAPELAAPSLGAPSPEALSEALEAVWAVS
jgi:hypothetical protein